MGKPYVKPLTLLNPHLPLETSAQMGAVRPLPFASIGSHSPALALALLLFRPALRSVCTILELRLKRG